MEEPRLPVPGLSAERLQRHDVDLLVLDVEHDGEREARKEHALERQSELNQAMVDADEATARQTTIDLFNFGGEPQCDRSSTAFAVVTRLCFCSCDGVLVDEDLAGHWPRAARCNRMTASSIDTSFA